MRMLSAVILVLAGTMFGDLGLGYEGRAVFVAQGLVVVLNPTAASTHESILDTSPKTPPTLNT